MKNTFGQSITVTLFGESHGAEIGAVIDGIAPGIKIDFEYIDKKLSLRRPSGRISTARCEKDEYRILSGVFNGYTTGTPIAVTIPNGDTRSCDYKAFTETPRPSHADYAAECKYHGFQDFRGGGHFSGRITAPIVLVGAILESALLKKGIRIATHISYLGGIHDLPIESEEDMERLGEIPFPTVSDEAAKKMVEKIEEVRGRGDSIGGILESVIVGLPSGIGEPYFDSIESTLSHALFSIPGIKGVEFGAGFGFANMTGSEANDPFTVKDGKVITKTNNNGGINGGISNGMPIVFRCAVKPTPSISMEQTTVNLSKMTEEKISIGGRHDPAIIHRARAVVDATAAIAVADMLVSRYGTDWLKD